MLRRLIAGSLAAIMLIAPPASAQRFELTPFAGWRFGGDLDEPDSDVDYDIDEHASYGLVFSWTLDYARQFEVLWSYQPTQVDSGGIFGGDPVLDLDVHYVHIGGTYVPGGSKRFRPFVSGGIGLTHMSPDRSGLDSETDFSLSLGVGVKAYLNDHLGLRLEARGYLTAMDSKTRLFCSGGCEVQVEASGFRQGEILLGVVAAFD
jgi:hypothetical protein